MQYLMSLTSEQHEAIKAAARKELVGIKYIIKRNTYWKSLDIYNRETASKWTPGQAERVRAFLMAQGLTLTGEPIRRDTNCHTGLRLLVQEAN